MEHMLDVNGIGSLHRKEETMSLLGVMVVLNGLTQGSLIKYKVSAGGFFHMIFEISFTFIDDQLKLPGFLGGLDDTVEMVLFALHFLFRLA